MSTQLDSFQTAARMMREAVKDKTYRAYPMGGEAGAYLRWKRGRMTASTYRDYESCLDKLARHFPDLEITDFEPPMGTERLEEWLDATWGNGAPRTYNKNLSITKDFFKWAVLKGKLHGDPTLPMRPHKKRDVHREVFGDDQRGSILASGPSEARLFRDRVALRLLLDYGLRKGALQKIQFKHFDHTRKRLTVFTKGEKVRDLPLVDPALWNDLERHILDWGAQPNDYLLPRQRTQFRGYDRETGEAITQVTEYRVRDGNAPTAHPQMMGEHGLHSWWYGCLERAGLVAEGQRRGERMHKARHSAGQRLLDRTRGNLKAAQMLLGHADISTTANIYVDWDIDQLADTLREVID